MYILQPEQLKLILLISTFSYHLLRKNLLLLLRMCMLFVCLFFNVNEEKWRNCNSNLVAHFQRRIALNYDCNSPLLIFAFWFRDTFWGFSSCDCRQNLIITLVSSEKNAFFGSNFRLQSQKWKRLQQICLNAVYSILNSKVQNAADFFCV